MVLGILICCAATKLSNPLVTQHLRFLTTNVLRITPVVVSSSNSSLLLTPSINRQSIQNYCGKINQTKVMDNKVVIDKKELKSRLTPLQYQVTQEAATERPFSGCYNKHYEKGVYQCIVCHQDLFSSDTKYDSGCGWPAFNDVLDQGKITLHKDASIPGGNILLLIKHPERIRTEVRCAKCNAHMGHVFEDGPKPTRKRYCINSAAIDFVTADELNAKGATEPTAAGN